MANLSSSLLQSKSNFSGIYNHHTSVRYYKELLKDKKLVQRNEILAKYTERSLVPIFEEWSSQLGKALELIDFMCCFGNDTLSVANCFYEQDFDSMWGSEDACYTLSKPRQFSVDTFGCDISANACAYGKKAGIFDDVLAADLNNLDESQRTLLKERCKNANILIMNSMLYLNDGIFEQVIEWFESGTDPGLLILGFVFPYDGIERCKHFKSLLMQRFDFFDSIPAQNRILDEAEGRLYGEQFGTWEQSFYENWILTRRKAESR